ncbi:MAG: PleD family two-component system response regulator [Rickettsiales bacterium]|jgi:two-component system cell cycle response regulator|nr:PleD family two-component system response regulator [Rickettsiales bacterium]
MTAQILVVDDVPANIKLLEAKLASEYYDVIAAKDGFEAIRETKEKKPDLVLLDVMMPGMDGFETCKKLKEDPEISHIPVVMVTALSDKADRLKGLEAGADDFLTKPINDTALFARVRSLVRIKLLLDELRLRDKTTAQMGIENQSNAFISDVSGASVLLIDDDEIQCKQVLNKLNETYKVEWVQDPEQAIVKSKEKPYDAILISTLLSGADGLRLASQIKGQEETRNVPILVFVDEEDQRIMLKALELGINDYLTVPVDKNEMTARLRTQIRRKRYQEALKSNYQQSVSMAVTDALTGLYNRHYLNAHLENMVKQSLKNGKNLALMIMDMDHFKSVNDTYGHDAGDLVLKQLAQIIIQLSRSTDLAARFGGEEFVILMPETDPQAALGAAKRLRESVESTSFAITNGEQLKKTVSIGVASLHPDGDSAESLLKRADEALYSAKHSGRNIVKVSNKLVPSGW